MPKKESVFIQRIARMLQKELGDIFLHEAKGVAGSVLVSVNDVQVTPDVSVARAYISLIGTKEPEATFAVLEAQTNTIRTYLTKRIRNKLREMPTLKFVLDDSVSRAAKIEQLLRD